MLGLHRLKFSAVLTGFIFVAGVSASSVYKCEKDGTVIFSDTPCDLNEETIEVQESSGLSLESSDYYLERAQERELQEEPVTDQEVDDALIEERRKFLNKIRLQDHIFKADVQRAKELGLADELGLEDQ